MFPVILIFVVALVFILSVVLPICGLLYRKTVEGKAGIFVASAIVGGFVAGGMLTWSFVPAVWTLSFAKTLAASVDAVKYGHPVEHYAQGVVWMVLTGSVAGAVLSAVTAAIGVRFFANPRPVCPC